MSETTDSTPIPPALTPQFSQKIHEILRLTDLANDAADRRAFLALAFGPGHPLLDEIAYANTTRTFLTNLIAKLYQYGEITPGTLALTALLLFAKTQIGADRQAQIDQLIDEFPTHSAGPSPSSLPSPGTLFQIPFARNPFFTGRETEIEELGRLLRSEDTVSLPVALIGLGGIGKTQTVVEFAYRNLQRYTHLFWVDSEIEDTLRTGFANILRQVAPARVQQNDDTANTQATRQWLSTHSGWLLILDNADDVALIHRYLPASSPGQILLTSRTRAWGTTARSIAINRLSEEEGTTLLLRRAGRIGPRSPLSVASPTDQSDARTLSREVGGLALAIDQAGAYIEKNGKTIADYHRLYTERGKELRAKREGESPTEHDTVAVTYSLSLEKFRSNYPLAVLLPQFGISQAAIQVMQYCALLSSDPIPETLFIKGAALLKRPLSAVAPNPIYWDQAIGALHNYSLLERSPGTGTLTLHCVVQKVILDTMDDNIKKQHIHSLLLVMIDTDSDPDYLPWEECERLLPHWRVICQHIQKYNIQSSHAAWILNRTGHYLCERTIYSEAESLYEQALAIRENVLGKRHPDAVQSFNNLANLYKNQGKFDQAESLYQRLLAFQDVMMGKEHPYTIETRNNIELLHRQRGREMPPNSVV